MGRLCASGNSYGFGFQHSSGFSRLASAPTYRRPADPGRRPLVEPPYFTAARLETRWLTSGVSDVVNADPQIPSIHADKPARPQMAVEGHRQSADLVQRRSA